MAKSYIIIPAYNEGPNLGAVLQQLQELASSMTLALIVVNDGSRDSTLQQAERFRNVMDLDIVSHPITQGVPKTFYDGLVAAAARDNCPRVAPGCWYTSLFIFGDPHYNAAGNALVADAVIKSLQEDPPDKMHEINLRAESIEGLNHH